VKHYNEIAPESIEGNPFEMIGRKWFLITAGVPGDYNTMTGGWGALGYLWNRPVAIAYVRPVRHTFNFTEKNRWFTLSFFPESRREDLRFCGSNSGRDVDKAAATGLTPFQPTPETVSFSQAELILVCRKLYAHFLKPAEFTDPSVDSACYPRHDHHRVYIGEIAKVLRMK